MWDVVVAATEKLATSGNPKSLQNVEYLLMSRMAPKLVPENSTDNLKELKLPLKSKNLIGNESENKEPKKTPKMKFKRSRENT